MSNYFVPATTYVNLTTVANLVAGEFYTIQTIGSSDIELQQRSTPPVQTDTDFILFFDRDRTYGQVAGMSLYARSLGVLPSRIAIILRSGDAPSGEPITLNTGDPITLNTGQPITLNP